MKKGIAIETTFQLKDAITDALDRMNMNKDEIRKSCQRTFQALRIEVNDEFKALEQFLDKLPDALAQGGRVAILAFHSGEDRRVKKHFSIFTAKEYSAKFRLNRSEHPRRNVFKSQSQVCQIALGNQS